MGCLNLAYYENVSPLKVVHRNFESKENICVGGYRWGFNGQEMDDEVSESGNLNKTLFCQYDTWLERKWNLYTKGNFWKSIYSSLGNNAISDTAFLGDKWKPKNDKNKAENVKQEIAGRIKSRQKELTSLNKKARKYYDKGDLENIGRYYSKTSELNRSKKSLESATSEINEMVNSKEVTFRFTQLPENAEVGELSCDLDGTVVINHTISTGYKIHELKKAHQLLTGGLDDILGTKLSYYVDLTDEFKTYLKQYVFDSWGFKLNAPSDMKIKSDLDISVQYLKGIHLVKNEKKLHI